MTNQIIINFSVTVFFLVFLIILFLFINVILSLFKKTKYKNFEPNVSIVIPCFNVANSIKPCLNSIRKLNYPKNKIEIIVVDDGSTDNTKNLVKNFKDVKCIWKEHSGKADTLNFGVRKTKFPFILTLDADTLLDRNFLKEIVKPFSDLNVGATSGVPKVKNKNNILTHFQNLEYNYNNLIRNSFSRLYGTDVWFFGSVGCYRKSALKKIGLFGKDTIAEDFDIAMRIKKLYKTISVENASCYTIVPENITGLYKQRLRWWVGGLQSLIKNKEMIVGYGIISYLYVNQFFWSLYSLMVLPLIIYQINYWLPYNVNSIWNLFLYFFRWFSLAGPVYVIYKIPVWGISYFTIFGVLAGILSSIMATIAVIFFKKPNFYDFICIFFYFPYTIVLNIMIIFSLLRYDIWKKRTFMG